ncbi:hypothetical protein HDU76_013418, partial [Blyttiomyces sp. JEL0837]
MDRIPNRVVVHRNKDDSNVVRIEVIGFDREREVVIGGKEIVVRRFNDAFGIWDVEGGVSFVVVVGWCVEDDDGEVVVVVSVGCGDSSDDENGDVVVDGS